MRVAILVSSLPPRSVGGAETQAHRTAIGLAARGHAVTVFARAVPGDPAGATTDQGVTWVRIPVPRVPGLSFAVHGMRFRREWARRRGREFDVVLAYQTVINGVLGAWVADVPLVTWIRSEWEIRPDWSRKYRLLTPWVLDRSSRILVQSRSLEETLLREMHDLDPDRARRLEGRIRVLGNAVTLGPEPGYTDRSGLVTLGRLVHDKGLDVLLDALGRIPDPPNLRILGDGPLRPELERAAQGLPVTIAGAVAPQHVAAEIGTSRVFVLASRTEGFPNAVLEAMERGVPPVATRVGAVPELVADGTTGRIVPPGDPEALSRAIEALLADDAGWERMARAARGAARSYGWDTHLDRLEPVLREAAATRGTS